MHFHTADIAGGPLVERASCLFALTGGCAEDRRRPGQGFRLGNPRLGRLWHDEPVSRLEQVFWLSRNHHPPSHDLDPVLLSHRVMAVQPLDFPSAPVGPPHGEWFVPGHRSGLMHGHRLDRNVTASRFRWQSARRVARGSVLRQFGHAPFPPSIVWLTAVEGVTPAPIAVTASASLDFCRGPSPRSRLPSPTPSATMIFRAVAGPIPGHAVRNSNSLIFEYGPSGALMISAGLTVPALTASFAAALSLRASIAFLSAASLWSVVSLGSTPLTSHPFARARRPAYLAVSRVSYVAPHPERAV